MSTVGAAALNVALRYEGAPYVWGGSSPEVGFDCSGLTMYSYAQIGISIPRTDGAQLAALQRRGRFTTKISELQYGDLVFFPGHGCLLRWKWQLLRSPSTGSRAQARPRWPTLHVPRRAAISKRSHGAEIEPDIRAIGEISEDGKP